MALGELYKVKKEHLFCLGYIKNKIYVNMAIINKDEIGRFYCVGLQNEKGMFYFFNNISEVRIIGRGLLIEKWN